MSSAAAMHLEYQHEYRISETGDT